MAGINQFTSNFLESSSQGNVDIGTKYVTKSYLIDTYPYLTGLGNIRFAGLFSTGGNNNGQLCDGTSTDRSSPVQTIAGGTTWKQVATSFAGTTAAIKTDGTLWTCGYNADGELGDNTIVSKSSPVQVVGNATTWKQVDTGRFHTTAIKTDGTLWIWGYNLYGQLGDSTLVLKSSPVQTIASGTTWKQVAGGQWHTSAIKTDGTLWSWGNGGYGQLGDSNLLTIRSSPVQTIALGNNWKQVSCGGFHTAAIKNDGTLWAWGQDSFGQCGNTVRITRRSSPIQTSATGTNWKQVSCGYQFTMAIKTDGSLWSWGNNGFGQLGDSTIVHKSAPVQVIGNATNWKQVSCGKIHHAAIKTDGTLWTCGYNINGQLGDSTDIRKSSPVQTIAGGNNWKSVSAGGTYTIGITEMGDDF